MELGQKSLKNANYIVYIFIYICRYMHISMCMLELLFRIVILQPAKSSSFLFTSWSNLPAPTRGKSRWHKNFDYLQTEVTPSFKCHKLTLPQQSPKGVSRQHLGKGHTQKYCWQFKKLQTAQLRSLDRDREFPDASLANGKIYATS